MDPDPFVKRLASAVVMRAVRDAATDDPPVLSELEPWAAIAGLRPAKLRQVLQDAREGRLDALLDAQQRDARLLELGHKQRKPPRGKAPRWGPYWA